MDGHGWTDGRTDAGTDGKIFFRLRKCVFLVFDRMCLKRKFLFLSGLGLISSLLYRLRGSILGLLPSQLSKPPGQTRPTPYLKITIVSDHNGSFFKRQGTLPKRILTETDGGG